MRRSIWLLALGVGAYLVFALYQFPAATAYRLLAPDTLRLSGIDGTIWSGRAALGSVAGLPLHDIGWTLDALPLLTAQLSGRVEARLSDGFVEGDVTAWPDGRAELRDVNASTSLRVLASLVPGAEAEGLVSATIARLELRDGWPVGVAGEARIADLAAPPLISADGGPASIPLGDYTLTLETSDAGELLVRFQDSGGPLDVDGTARLDPRGNYRLEGRAAARPDAPPELVQGLELIGGEPDAEGMRPFEMTGSL